MDRRVGVGVYLCGKRVIVPTSARTRAGFYLEIEPVRVAEADDASAIREIILLALETGNPSIATPPRDKFPKPVVLKHAKVRSWVAFERLVRAWQVYKSAVDTEFCRYERTPPRGLSEVEATRRKYPIAGLDSMLNDLIGEIQGEISTSA